MADRDPPMSNANPTFWYGLSLGGMIFLAGFMAWAVIFGFGHGPSEQQASAPQQTTGQAAQPAQQKPK
jgi:hypothetical protein